jgi:hypothetical protein
LVLSFFQEKERTIMLLQANERCRANDYLPKTSIIYLQPMEQSYFIARLHWITVPELLDAIAEANYGKPVDIYEFLAPDLIDKVTDALGDFIDAVKKIEP